jgi:sec-independent protein translocase protein TatA
MHSLFAFALGTQEILIILVLGVLLFGRRLPEVGRYLGKGIVEFKKGLKGLEDEVEGGASVSAPAPRQEPVLDAPRPPQRVTASVPKFEDAPAPAPVEQAPPTITPPSQHVTTQPPPA